jgi:hypothetical protein
MKESRCGAVAVGRTYIETGSAAAVVKRSIEWLCDLPLKHTEAATVRILFESLEPLTYASVWLAFCDLYGPIAHYEIDSQRSGHESLPSGIHAATSQSMRCLCPLTSI